MVKSFLLKCIFSRSQSKLRCLNNDLNIKFKASETRRTLFFEKHVPSQNQKSNSIFKESNQLAIRNGIASENEIKKVIHHGHEFPSVDTPERKNVIEKGVNDPKKLWSVIGYGCFSTVIKARYKSK